MDDRCFDDGAVTWTITEGDGTGDRLPLQGGPGSPRPLLIDFIKGEGAHASDVSMVIDLNDGRVIVADSTFVDREARCACTPNCSPGAWPAPAPSKTLHRSSELVGKRIFYRWPTEAYEHVYLNGGTFMWHCVRGAERGLAGVDRDRLRDRRRHRDATPGARPSCRSSPSCSSTSSTRAPSGGCSGTPTLAPVHLPFDSRFTVLNETAYPND